jgi:hypothetical protein
MYCYVDQDFVQVVTRCPQNRNMHSPDSLLLICGRILLCSCPCLDVGLDSCMYPHIRRCGTTWLPTPFTPVLSDGNQDTPVSLFNGQQQMSLL